MTLIPAKRQNSFGCASLRQLPFLTPEYRDGLRLFFNAGIDFAYYGYNASNTRTYKLSMLNMNQWLNGQPQPLNLQLQNAMFYPNAYINFNHNGEYTKHYYNGTERIASRLGNATLNITTTANSRLTSRTTHADNRFQTDVQDLVDEDIPLNNAGQAAGYTPIPLTSLAVTGTSSDIYYYHTNHLGSTAFVTDQNQTVTQGFLYAPFGEITTEYNSTFGNDIIPKYSFNAKELDEETGMYYYEARYYKPPVFTSRDAMFEKYFWMTPYAYCANNPVKYVDPNGRDIELNFILGKNRESSAELFKTIINNGLQGQFEVYYTKGKRGAYSLQIRATENGGDLSQMSSEAKSFYEKLSSMINDHTTTAVIDVVYGSSDVIVGHYRDNKIDIADINQFNDIGKDGATKQGKLIHELVEQFGKAKSGHIKGESYGRKYNHKKGIAAENAVNGNIRSIYDKTIARGIYQETFSTKDEIIHCNINTNYPIIKVSQSSVKKHN